MRRINVAQCAAPTWALICSLLFALPASATVMTFGASKDATLFESFNGALSGGGEDGIFVGRTDQGAGIAIRRGLIAFDLAAIPTGATINSVSLRMSVVLSPSSGAAPNTVGLHRLLGNWGEGTVNPAGQGGAGGVAGAGDATWIHQARPGDLWDNPGGDFVANSSAAQVAGAGGTFVTWTSTPPLVEDVQRWVNDPTLNFGWLLRGSETLSKTARKFGSRTALPAGNRPLLTIDFTLPVTRTPGDINNDGVVNAADVALLASFYGETTTANNFNLGEFSGDGLVGLADMAILQRNLSPVGLGSPAAVPEPAGLALICCGVCFAGFSKLRRTHVLARR